MRTRLPLTLLTAVALVGALAACTPTARSDDTGTGTGGSTTTDGGATTDGDGFSGVTIPGSGSYAIPDDIPYGSYQLVGDPGVLPDGCTWSITGDSGTVADSNGAYVFITEIDEADTFTTNGCPDWEQFE